MFRPTQTAPTILTAFNIVVGFVLAIALTVLALLNSVETGVIAELRADADYDTGLLFLTGLLCFIAAIRPLAGGLALLVMGVLIVGSLPLIGAVAMGFGALSLLRAFLSRRYLAEQKSAA